MRLAIGASTILLMFSAVVLAQLSPDEAEQRMQDRVAKKKRRPDRRTSPQPNQAILPTGRLP